MYHAITFNAERAIGVKDVEQGKIEQDAKYELRHTYD